MQTPDTQKIQERFFDAIQALKDCGYCNLSKFCALYGIDRRNLAKAKADPQRQIFQTAWLAYLVRDFGVNAHWLLTGDGDVFLCTSKER